MSDLPNEFNEPVLLAIIGGTGLYKLDCLHPVAKLHVTTPWGAPSSAITISKTASGFPIAFLARHGEHHSLTPSDVPSRANIAALKHLGVKAIVAFSAVGSLQEHIKPRDFVVPTQVIDRTKVIRPSSFFDSGFVAHAGFGDPFDLTLNKFVNEVVRTHELKGDSSVFHTKETEKNDLTLICMEGPAFSTRAESKLYRSWGGSVINMSCLPEAKLAREAEIAYQMICMSTDYDAWRDDSEPVTVETVVGHLTANGENARFVATTLIEALEQPLIDGTVGNDLIGSMKFAVSTAPHARAPKVAEKVKYLFPDHWL